MRYRMNVNWKRLKAVPKICIVLWVALFVSLIFCTVKAAIPSSLWIDKTKHETITVTDISLFDSHNIRGSRYKLTIKSPNDTFYLWYPAESFSKHKDTIEKNLTAGLVTQVSVTYLSGSTMQDVLTGHYRIVDLRTDDTVFYELSEEISHWKHTRLIYLVLSVVLLLIWVIGTILVAVIYGVMSFSPPQNRKREK